MRTRPRTAVITLVASAVTATLVAATPTTADAGGGPLASSIAVDWQRTAVRTAFVERGSSAPLGALYLSFTSLAVHDAATTAIKQGSRAAAAAVAVAAHDVLLAYYPASKAGLDADLAASLALVPDGPKEDAGVAIGAAAAQRMIASRVGDGRNDSSVVYSKPVAPGYWQPAAGGSMALPWLAYVKPVVAVAPVALAGPDPLTSAAYATDYDEVLRLGSVASTERTDAQTAAAKFFAGNPVLQYRNALCDLLDAEPLGLLPTTRLFARIDAAVAQSFIQTWKLKLEIGFWRPFQAIAGAADDGNPATTPVSDWKPLVPNPSYADYTSGHAAATAPFAEVLRETLGDDTPLTLRSGGVVRSYSSLSALEYDALNARIWGGLHFRHAMEDGYHLGHVTADRVIAAIR